MQLIQENPTKAIQLLRQMMQIRRFEEKAAEMYTKMFIRGFMHLYIGEEAVAVGICQALQPHDNVLSTYRDHGHALAKGITSKAIMAEMYGRMEGCSRGRGGSMHLFDVSKNFFGGNAIVASHLPVAVGMALAAKKQGKDQITVCFFGEGAAAEGEFHEAFNLAALWEVPVLFVCENNEYAMGTPLRFEHSVGDLYIKGSTYGIMSSAVNGMSLPDMVDAADKATAYIRATGKPFFLECKTYRFRAHSMFDAELYRNKAEVELWKQKDPILAYSKMLMDHNILTERELEDMRKLIDEEMNDAVSFAEAGTWEAMEEITRFMYSENVAK